MYGQHLLHAALLNQVQKVSQPCSNTSFFFSGILNQMYSACQRGGTQVLMSWMEPPQGFTRLGIYSGSGECN